MKGRQGIHHFVTMIFVLLALTATSCVENTGNGKKKEATAGLSDDSNDVPDSPEFDSNDLNYFQDGQSQYTTNFKINADFSTTFYYRGFQIDRYLKAGNTTVKHCLVVPFRSVAVNKVLVMAATATSINVFASGTREDFFLLSPSAKSDNQTFCQTAGMLTMLASEYSGLTPVYSLADVCPNCVLSSTQSDITTLRSTQGQTVSDIISPNLRIEVLMQTTPTPGNNDGLSCSSNSECESKNFDCCSGEGQCINDKSIKSGVDQTSTEFQQALADIGINPDNIYNYSQFYNLCARTVTVDPEPTAPVDPNIEEQERFLRNQALYKCTTPLEGEKSVCQQIYTDVDNGTFATGNDDLNFTSQYYGTQTRNGHSIEAVTYGNDVLYANGSILKGMTISAGNDDLTTAQEIVLNHTLSETAPNKDLKISYAINGSCERINSLTARCYKVYEQGQNSGLVTDHFPMTDDFSLPFYADTTKLVEVYVNDIQRFQAADWQLITNVTPNYITFQNPGLDVTITQTVKIYYYVDLQVHTSLLEAKELALQAIQTNCNCVGNECGLEEKTDSSGDVIDYVCKVPTSNAPKEPLQVIVDVSTKNVPVRLFDQTGAELDTEGMTTTTTQEGNLFEYTDNNKSIPNNVNQYVGFNEIYGQIRTGTNYAKPPIQVKLEQGRKYDFFTVSGGLDKTCTLCGKDYYSNLVDIFPKTYDAFGGGYTPDLTTNNPFTTQKYRRDDMLFGRACYVPITMLPYTHVANSDRNTQRRNRMSAQHFMYANGAGRDWYGFDYGALIGSFDGVKWFAIGTERRIEAESNILYLAVNSYFADLANYSSYRVKIVDAVLTVNDLVMAESDYETTGAECQRYHSCSKDQDCISQLGYDYACEEVRGIQTSWPKFDSTAVEIANSSEVVSLTNILNTNLSAETGGTKRCVYRGRGSACIPDYTQTNTAITFDGTDKPSLHACTSNNYCQPILSGGLVSRFNDRIARFGESVARQNDSDDIAESDLDLFGLGSRLLGRPYSWNGTQTAPVVAQGNLSNNNVDALCIPGRSSNNNNLGSNHSATPGFEDGGDQIGGVGVTPDLTLGLTGSQSDYLSRCSIVDDQGNYLHRDIASNTLLSDASIVQYSGRQAIASNALVIFEQPQMTDSVLVRDFDLEFIEEFAYQKNRCLRAPGSTCFSDLECAPNNKISGLVRSVDPEDISLSAILNSYEIRFWQEELVCSQEKKFGDEDYDPTLNRCCRETNKTITIGSATTNNNGLSYNDFDPGRIPGINISLSSSQRYSRVSTAYDLMTGSKAVSYPTLSVAQTDECAGGGCGDVSTLNNQFNTFAATASRTCCSKNWIRDFHEEDNGGGHAWSPDKLQTIPKESFRCYNWRPCNQATGQCGDEDAGDSINGFTCSHVDQVTHPNCLARNVDPNSANKVFDWIERYDLAGIPQIAIQTSEHPDIACSVNPDDQSDGTVLVGGEYLIPPDIQKSLASEDAEYVDVNARRYYSSTDKDNFDTDNIKRIFSPDTVSCCTPAGTRLEEGADPKQCCTGFINDVTNRCALPDFADVSLYLNRYISSEADELTENDFNPATGFIKSNTRLLQIACEKRICASGTLAPGVMYSQLNVRGKESSDIKRWRFIDGDDESNNKNGLASLVDAGLKWNNHYYCVPADAAVTNNAEVSLPGLYICDQ